MFSEKGGQVELHLQGLRRVRETRLFSMQKLADTANVAKGTVFRIEHGKPATPETAKKLASALDVSLEELVRQEGVLVPLARGSVQRAAEELALILDRDVEMARRFNPEGMWGSILTRACKAFLSLQERRVNGEAVPAELERRFAEIIEACLDAAPKDGENDRADELLRKIGEPVGA